MEQLKYSSKMIIPKLKSNHAEWLLPTPQRLHIYHPFQLNTGTRVQKPRHTRTHPEETPNSLHQK